MRQLPAKPTRIRPLGQCPSAGPVPTIPIPILLYHSISEVAAPQFSRWAVHPERFASQLDYLRAEGYTTLTVSQLARMRAAEGMSLPERPILLTFDDGLADFYTGALPHLRRHRFVATLYITTDYVGKASRWLAPAGEGERPMLTWEQIAELGSYGIECGAHTRSHPQLDTLSLTEAHDEILGSKRALERQLGKAVISFAYPHGYHSPAVKKLVAELGFTSACGVKHALSDSQDDPLALARIIISADTDADAFRGMLGGQGLRATPRKETWQTKGWRLYRRFRKTLQQPPQGEVLTFSEDKGKL